MLFRTHLAGGIFFGLLLYGYAENKIAFFVGVLLFSSFPDIDHWRSTYGKFLGIGGLMQFLFKHRGFLHSLLFAGILYYLTAAARFKSLGQGLLVGYFTHAFLDGLTKQGITPLHPFQWMKLRGPFVTGGMLEGGLFMLFLAGIAIAGWNIFSDSTEILRFFMQWVD